MMQVDRFISGDWGTSRLRLRLVRREPFEILETIETEEGIAAVHDRWRATKDSRENYFETILRKQVAEFRVGGNDLPIVLSGMASSTIGWRELPYGSLPHQLAEFLPVERAGSR